MGEPLSPIGIIPPGLLGLLQLKQLGRLPAALQDSVQPSLDMRDWWFQGRRESALALNNGVIPSINLTAVGAGFNWGALSIVPQGQMWYVEHMHVYGVIAAAADTIRAYPGYFAASGGNDVIQVGRDYADTASATVVRDWSCYSERGFWMVPGDSFVVCVLDIKTATQITAQLAARFTRLPI